MSSQRKGAAWTRLFCRPHLSQLHHAVQGAAVEQGELDLQGASPGGSPCKQALLAPVNGTGTHRHKYQCCAKRPLPGGGLPPRQILGTLPIPTLQLGARPQDNLECGECVPPWLTWLAAMGTPASRILTMAWQSMLVVATCLWGA